MRPERAEWVAKAEADFASMQRENSVVQSPNYDLICFLAQQCVEKYLKGPALRTDHFFSEDARPEQARRAASSFILLPAKVRSHAGSSRSLLRGVSLSGQFGYAGARDSFCPRGGNSAVLGARSARNRRLRLPHGRRN
jgi:HEPN domain